MAGRKPWTTRRSSFVSELRYRMLPQRAEPLPPRYRVIS